MWSSRRWFGALNPAHAYPISVRNRDSGPNASARTPECSPSAPITRSTVRGAPWANVTSTPEAVSVSDVIQSPKTYSVRSFVASYSTRLRSPRWISTSPLIIDAGRLATRFPDASRMCCSPIDVWCARISSSNPIRRSTDTCSPRKSTACPPSRRAGARSTTVVA